MKQFCLFLALFIIAFTLFSCTKGGLGEGSTYSGVKTDASGITTGYSSGASSPGGGNAGYPGDTAGVMTAGEWNDLFHWDFWNQLLQRDTIKTLPGIWGFYTNHRVSVVVRDNGGRLVHNVMLTLSNGSETYNAVTDNSGRAEFFPGLYSAGYSMPSSFFLKANFQGQVFDLGNIPAIQDVINKTLPVSKLPSSNLDIMFVVDATGSMGDEISYLKTELDDVVSRAGVQLTGTRLRMGSVFYRDHGDDYIVRPFPFTTNVSQLQQFINNQSAMGGGDFPEAVDEALDAAINQQQWSTDAINRIIFLVLDAPSHKTDAVLNRLRNAIKVAQQKGIRIIPVSASGIDHETEFLLRFLSVSTNSTYVFITNHSGIGNSHLTPTVGNYDVEYLNNLMVRLITKYGVDKD